MVEVTKLPDKEYVALDVAAGQDVAMPPHLDVGDRGGADSMLA